MCALTDYNEGSIIITWFRFMHDLLLEFDPSDPEDLAFALHKAVKKSACQRVSACLPVCVTCDPEPVRRPIDDNMSMYGDLPSYKAM